MYLFGTFIVLRTSFAPVLTFGQHTARETEAGSSSIDSWSLIPLLRFLINVCIRAHHLYQKSGMPLDLDEYSITNL
ncbi:hypothetical protein Hanom_Chr01g00010951 [Helianthus anomalus]